MKIVKKKCPVYKITSFWHTHCCFKMSDQLMDYKLLNIMTSVWQTDYNMNEQGMAFRLMYEMNNDARRMVIV